MTNSTRRAGFTVIEVVMAGSILFLLVFGTLMAVQRESNDLAGIISQARTAKQSRVLLTRIESELTFAQVAPTATTLTAAVGGGGLTLPLANLQGLPQSSILLLDRGMATEERVLYSTFDAGLRTVTAAERGLQCTEARAHDMGSQVLWAGPAEAIEDQSAPPAWDYDGIASERSGNLYFQGDGFALSYRVPITQPGDSFIQDGIITWGASVAAGSLDTGCSALTYEATTLLMEADLGQDLNGDGDQEDLFDLGHIRILSWDTEDADVKGVSVGICPNIVLQEQCNWGGDLDSDGFDDPIFLWMPDSQRLHVRLFTYRAGDPVRPVEMVESVIYLQNGVEQG